jgi:hypothetical protein
LPDNISQTLAYAGPGVRTYRDEAGHEGVRRSVLFLFILLLSLLAIPFVAAVDPAAVGLIIVATWIAAWISPVVGWMPKWVFLVGMFGPGISGPIYFIVCRKEIDQLLQPYRALGWISCLGLGAMEIIAIVSMVSGMS